MADFAGTAALVDWKVPFEKHPGHVVATVTLTAATYGSGNLNLSTIASSLPSQIAAHPEWIQAVMFQVGSTNTYLVNWTKASSPTWSNLGTLALNTATGTAATGTLTFVVQCYIVLGAQNPF